MKRKFTFLIAAAVMLLTMMASTGTMWGQSDYSTNYTGNVTLSTSGGSNASACKVKINNTDYDGIKAGTNSKTGAVKITVPSNTKYLHLHVAAWNGETVTLAVAPNGYSGNIALTSNSGISGSSTTYTFSGDPSTSDYYKVITFTNALTANTDLTFTATGGKRFVVWGATAEEEGGGGSTVATPTITGTDDKDYFVNTTNITLACETSDATIQYKLDEGNWTNYSAPFQIDATTTVYAKATKNGWTDSSTANKLFTKLSTISAVRTQATGKVYTQGTITSVSGKDAFIQDNDAAICVRGDENITQSVGDNIRVYGTLGSYGGLLQIQNPVIEVVSTGNTVAPTVMTIAEVNASTNQGWFVKIVGATVGETSNNNTTLTQNANSIIARSLDLTGISLGDVINLTGNISEYNSTKQIANPLVVVSPTLEADPASLSFTYIHGGSADDKDLTISGDNLEDDITITLSGVNFAISEDGIDWTHTVLTIDQADAIGEIYVRFNSGLDVANNYSGTITLSSNNADNVVVNLTGSVTGETFAIEQYSTPATAHGTITFTPESPIEEGTQVTLTATPAAGYDFTADSWVFYKQSGEDYVIDNTIVVTNSKITMPAYNLWVDATFVEKPIYAITKVVTPDNSGTVETDIEAWEGKTVTVLVEAANGYAFSNIVISKTGEPETTIPTTGSAASGFTFTMPGYAVTATATFEEKTQVTYNFSEIDGFGDWGSSYDEHVVEYTDATVTFASANHSSSTITDIPVTKGNPVSIELKNGITLTGATFVCRQWSNKAQTITLHYSTDGGENYTATTPTSTNFTITNNALADGTNAVRITFSSQSNQVGIESATLRFAGQKHAITLASVSNGTISADKTSASANQIVTLTATPNQGYAFDTWTVYKTGDIQTSITVENNQFVMPNYPVTVSATFAASYPITFSVNGSTTIQNYVQGSLITLPIPTENIPSGYSFVGWTDDEEDVSTLLSSYIVNSAATLYAVFVKTDSITITGDGFGTYSDEEVTINGITYGVNQVMKSNSNQIQIKASVGYLYNKDAFNNMISIVATQSGTHRDVTLKVGTTENPDEGTTIAPTTKDMIDSYSIPENMTYFVLTNTSGNALYYSSIVFNFSDPTSSRYTRVYPSGNIEPDEDITIITPTVISSGTVLNMGTYDLECTDPANLVIEDGGQVIVNNTGVQATFKKSVSHGAAKTAANWYTISSPVNNIATASVTNLIQDPATKYDLYYYDEATQMWKNHKANAITNMTNGRGYLYWNTDGDELSFPGELNSGNVEIAVTTTGTGDLAGFNLIGNPYSHNIYKGDGTAIPNSILSAGYYTLSNAGAWTAGTDNTTAIKPGQGILVKATAAGTVTMTNTTANGAKRNNEFIKFMIANSQYEDVAYALFNDEEGLNKINHRNADIPMLYIPQDGQNYAIATMSDETQSFNLNLRVMTTGQYTLSFKAEGKYDYLHVIDRMTGEDIDMLLNGEYSFIASPRDNDARFIVKLGYNTNNSAENDIFAYQNGSDIVVNGEGELQVFDVTGRMVATQHVNGVQTVNVPSQGVFIFKLNEKTQKIVVR